ncbi:MAG: hypothetical protein GEU77_07715 [Deltaproteobacteria bacterium]|nr:hypothetical protein [Deltaproteobacteria bacterium]
MEKKEMQQRHQPLGAQSPHGILILDGEEFSPFPVFVDPERNLGDFIAAFIKNVQHHFFGTRPSFFQLDAQLAVVLRTLMAPVLAPHTQPFFQHVGGYFDSLPMLRLGGFSTHRRSCQRRAACRPAKPIRPRPADESLRVLRRVVRQPQSPLEMAFLTDALSRTLNRTDLPAPSAE